MDRRNYFLSSYCKTRLKDFVYVMNVNCHGDNVSVTEKLKEEYYII